ncbi:hypothetical protein NQ317_015218 [Molorchus minor]|uniref:RNase H type-1 domain-containing protein n=1 Tax=Molorchus minor TaxID=1323400 RepID=A0ABQ9JEM0_9CUCU|nr:hypothetical protein NQ317_015218 [Molorchus minor]
MFAFSKAKTLNQAALKALSYRCNSKTVWNCQKALNNLSLRNPETLVWILGHSGQESNEIADYLARKINGGWDTVDSSRELRNDGNVDEVQTPG